MTYGEGVDGVRLLLYASNTKCDKVGVRLFVACPEGKDITVIYKRDKYRLTARHQHRNIDTET